MQQPYNRIDSTRPEAPAQQDYPAGPPYNTRPDYAPSPNAPTRQDYLPPTRVETTSVSVADRIALGVNALFGLLGGLIAIRILLKLFAANPTAGFTAFIYNVTGPFLAPFSAVFATPTAHNSVFEFSSLLGLIIYALIGWGLMRLIQLFGQRQTTTVK